MRTPRATDPRALSTRPPLDRFQQIFQAIQSGSFPKREQLAIDLEVDVKTIQRDIGFMRERLHVPIGYDAQRRGYYFTEEITNFPMLELSEAEVVSVFIAQKALAAYRGTPFEKPLASAYGKLVSSLQGRVSIPWADLGNGVSFRAFQCNLEDLATFEAIGNAVRRSCIARFDYKKLGATRYARRIVEPHHLACVQGQWYCIAIDREKNSWRNFVLGRMRRVEMLAETFERDRTFDINTYLQKSFGIFTGGSRSQTVKLRFDAWAAQLVRERAWHPGQRLQELPRGEIEFYLQLTSFEEIEPWILSWGGHVHVLGPAALRRRLARTIATMQRNVSAEDLAS